MPKIAYIEHKFTPNSLQVIEFANKIIESYQAQGFVLTLRQLYYRFVASGLLPNNQREYSRLGGIINKARLAGHVDWEAIEDRGRSLNHISRWSDPTELIYSATDSYSIDLWEGQEYRVEVWVEKQALEAIIEQAANELFCESFACKGYPSQSSLWRAHKRLKFYDQNGQTPVIIYLGDHDPSGIDIDRDISSRMQTFGLDLHVQRIALNMDQILQYKPPPNPTKHTDSRSKGYIQQFGNESWELDALEPNVLHDLIQNTITEYLDGKLYSQRVDELRKQKEQLKKAAKNWKKVANFVENEIE